MKALRVALDDAGFAHTKIVGSDGYVAGDQVTAMAADAVFSKAVPILGLHYPCKKGTPSRGRGTTGSQSGSQINSLPAHFIKLYTPFYKIYELGM